MPKKSKAPYTRLLSWSLSFARSSSLSATFLATEEDWALIQSLKSKEVYLGEVAGKHSEVVYTADAEDFTVVTEDPKDIEVIARCLPDGTGFDIMYYLRGGEA